MTDDDVVLSLTQVSKRFSSGSSTVSALLDITAVLRRGERVALLGANGAGKTTCMDLMCGVTQPTSGDIRAFGVAPRRAVREGRLTAVLQTGGLLRDITVRETVQVMAGLHRRQERTDTVLADSGLTGLAKRLVGRCSGGEQQRLKYALALIPDPELLVLDEPAAGLDIDGRASLGEHVGQRALQGTTIVHSTHYLDEIERLADRVLLLRGGRLLADRRVAELVGPSASMSISAWLPRPETVVHAVQELKRLERVRDDGSSGSHLRLTAAPEVSDEVATRLLRDMDGAGLTVRPKTLEAALADLMEMRGLRCSGLTYSSN